jgi:hypothetical protein
MNEDQRQQVKDYLEQITGVPVKDRRIKAIQVNPSHHSLPPLYIEVGKVCSHLEPDAEPEKVLAIFETTVFLVCTPKRGGGKGLPYFFAREDVHKVEFMEA